MGLGKRSLTSFRSHAYTVRDTDSAELVADDAGVDERLFDPLTEAQNVTVARVSLVPGVSAGNHNRYSPDAGYTDHGFLEIGVVVDPLGSVQHGLLSAA